MQRVRVYRSVVLLALLCVSAIVHAQTQVALPGGRYYEGDLEDGEPYGFGSMVYPNGTHYRGQFVNGYREGRGTAVFYDGSRYEGEWRDDTMNGHGVLTLPDGQRYEGVFVNGEWRRPAR